MAKPTVLIIEDDPIARFVFRKLVTKMDIYAYEAINGQDALNVIDDHPEITHVFLDLNMPVMDGYGFLHYLNSGNGYRDLKIYVTSVTDESEFMGTTSQQNIGTYNVVGYNKKPFDMAQLTKILLSDASIYNK